MTRITDILKFKEISVVVQIIIFSLVALMLSSYGSPDSEQQSPKKPQYIKDQWVSEVRLGGAYQLRGKGFALLSTPEGNFWVSEGRSAAGYKLIELDLSKSQPSALIQKGDQQAWVGLGSVIVPRTRVVGSDELEKRLDDSGMNRTMYVVGENEPFTGTRISYREDGSKASETAFVDGKEHGMWIQYREDGLKYSETPFVDGKQHGTMIIYREDGSKREEYVFENNYQISSKKFNYYGYGLKRSETPYVDGKKHGTWIRYNEDGSKKEEIVYENGKEISRKNF